MTTAGPPGRIEGDADLAAVGAVLGDRARARMLLALGDGRALPASVLASEAGVAPSTASEHLAKLVAAGFVAARKHGRYRYYSLAGSDVSDLLEAAARLAPLQAVRSLREGTRAHALRLARACYDHLAGRLGVALTAAFLERGWLVGGTPVDLDRLSPRGSGGVLDPVAFALSTGGRSGLAEIGVAVPSSDVVRCCVDWTEQRHHLAGPHGRVVLARLLALGWLGRMERSRALRLTDEGRAGFTDWLGTGLTMPS